MTNPQDSSGQPNQYGQPTPYGMPAAPQYTEPTAQNIPVPSTVQAAFWVWVATVVLTLVGGIVTLTNSSAALATLKANNTAGLSDAQLQSLATTTLAVAAVVSVIFAGLYLLFAFKARAGRNWARIVLTVLAVLRLLSLAFGPDLFTVITVVGAVVATVLLFLPASNQYFTAKKVVR
jgi:hypothetical protein